MDVPLRPHRGGTVLGLGIVGLLSSFFLLPLGIAAWVLGSKDLRGMKEGRVDTAGRTPTQVGWVFGIVGTGLWVVIGGLTLLMVIATSMLTMTITSNSSGTDSSRTTKSYYSKGWFQSGEPKIEFEFSEHAQSDGTWVRDGHSTHWSRDGLILEQGDYTNGKRTGLWTFMNEDGTADRERTGIYENDVKKPD